MSNDDTRPLLPTHTAHTHPAAIHGSSSAAVAPVPIGAPALNAPTAPTPPTRSRLSTRLSQKAKGKQRAVPVPSVLSRSVRHDAGGGDGRDDDNDDEGDGDGDRVRDEYVDAEDEEAGRPYDDDDDGDDDDDDDDGGGRGGTGVRGATGGTGGREGRGDGRGDGRGVEWRGVEGRGGRDGVGGRRGRGRVDGRSAVEDVGGRGGRGKGGRGGGRGGGGRHVTVLFANEAPGTGEAGNLDIWVEDGESVGHVKDQVRALRPTLLPLSLRLIHSGRLLTDGILLLPWLRALEERVRRQATGLGGDVESVLKDLADAGLSDDRDPADAKGAGTRGARGADGDATSRVWLHCIVGGPEADKAKAAVGEEEDEAAAAPRRRGFDVLLDAGLSRADVQQMRRQFYESRGEEMPEGLDQGDINDEHARALEEQWIEGDMTAETATTSTDGLYTSILHGLLTGFLFPLMPWPFFREPPLPNFFDADAEAANGDAVSARVAGSEGVGGEMLPGVVFGKRMQMGILLGTILNFAFGALRFLN